MERTVRAHGTFVQDKNSTALINYIYPHGIWNKPDPDHASNVLQYIRNNNIKAGVQAFISQDTFAQWR